MSGFCCGCCSSDDEIISDYPMQKPPVYFDDPSRYNYRPPYGQNPGPYTPPSAPPGGPFYPPSHYTTPTGTYPTGYPRPPGLYPSVPPIAVCPPYIPRNQQPQYHHRPPVGNWHNQPGGKRHSVMWIHSTAGNPFPHNAVKGGRDLDGSDIFVGRAYHQGDLLPAKVIPSRHIAYVCHGGREIEKHEFEVLCQGVLSWQFSAGGGVPEGALAAGNTSDGETLYVGRVLHEGTQTVGKVQQSHGTCYIPYNGEEVAYSEYEVLTLN